MYNKILSKTLQNSFEKHKKALAVSDKGKDYSYAVLQKDLSTLVEVIKKLNPNNLPVAISLSPSYLSVLGVLSSVCSGSVYVPIEPLWPSLKIQSFLKSSSSGVFIVDASLEKRKFNSIFYEKKIIQNYCIYYSPKNISIKNLALQKATKDLSYIMYTSGSTGYPKGVEVSEKSFMVFLNWIKKEFKILSTDKFLYISSLSFGGSLRQIFSPLLSGSKIVCCDSLLLKSPETLLRKVQKEKVTILNLPPVVLERMTERENDNIDYCLPLVRWVLSGGDILRSSVIKKWFKIFLHKHSLVNLYGSTETVINGAFFCFNRDNLSVLDEHSFALIGRAREGIEIKFFIDNKESTKINTPGTLFLGGDIAKTYHNLRSNIPTPFSLIGEKTFFNTGDRAILLDSGDYIVLGREDTQIQLYGQRIELGEVEHHLHKIKGVKRVSVVDVKNQREHIIIAFIQKETGLGALKKSKEEKEAEKNIKKHLLTVLPTYSVPKRIVFVDTMPKSSVQKIDTVALKEQARQYLRSSVLIDTSSQASAGFLELKNIWQKYLQVDNISKNDNFFDLGGDSIMVIEIYHVLCKVFNKNLDPFLFYKHPVLKNMLVEIQKPNVEKSLTYTECQSSFSLSPHQKFFYFRQDVQIDNGELFISLEGNLDNQKLENALNCMIQSQESLRTIFNNDKQFVLGYSQCASFKVLYYDLKKFSASEKLEHCFELRNSFLYKKIDISVWPLFKVVVFQHEKNKYSISVIVHHIIGDGWSAKIFLLNLLKFYKKNTGLGKVDKKFSYIQYTEKYKAFCREVYSENDRFWKEEVKDLSSFNMSLSKNISKKDIVLFNLNSKHIEKIEKMSKDFKTTSFYILFSLWSRALSSSVNSKNILFSTAHSGRSFPLKDLLGLMGCVARVMPIKASLVKKSFSEDLTILTKVFENATCHSDYNIPKIFSQAYSGDMYQANIKLLSFFFTYIDLNLPKKDISSKGLSLDMEGVKIRFSSHAESSFCQIFFSIYKLPKSTYLQVSGRASVEEKRKVINFFIKDLEAF